MNPTAAPASAHPSKESFGSLPEPIRVYIRYLEGIIEQQQVKIQQLETHVHELQARLAKDSSNSGKPPSSDGLKRKTRSLREKSGKKPGGQKGHIGKGLSQVSNPDEIVTHTPSNCTGCGSDLSNIVGSCAEKRQVFDIPQPEINVTEHRVEEKQCPCCGEIIRASFPENIRGPVQYGDRVRALIAYFSHEHFIPVERVCAIFYAHKEVEKHVELGRLAPEIELQIEQTYRQILSEGFAYHASLPPLPKKQRGRQKQRNGKNLLDRFQEKRDCVLRFIHDFSVPFSNNQGEQDMRMVKLKQKISGCFRALTGGQMFCRIRSYIATARKQDWNVWDALADAIGGSPRLLVINQRSVEQEVAA